MINLYTLSKMFFNLSELFLENQEYTRWLNKNLDYNSENLALYIYRLQNEIISEKGEQNSEEILKILSYLQRMLTQMEIYYSAKIGKNLKIIHGLGLVVGARVIIGDNVRLYQNVTLGDRGDRQRPVIHDNVVISAGAKVLGGITIGNNSIIGANAVVIKSFEENSIIAGVPAKLIRKL